jgi:hypothetical protein
LKRGELSRGPEGPRFRRGREGHSMLRPYARGLSIPAATRDRSPTNADECKMGRQRHAWTIQRTTVLTVTSLHGRTIFCKLTLSVHERTSWGVSGVNKGSVQIQPFWTLAVARPLLIRVGQPRVSRCRGGSITGIDRGRSRPSASYLSRDAPRVFRCQPDHGRFRASVRCTPVSGGPQRSSSRIGSHHRLSPVRRGTRRNIVL